MSELYQCILPQRLKGARIDSAIAELLPELSRNKIIALIKKGKARINGAPFKAKDKVSGDEVVTLSYVLEGSTRWQATKVEFDIVFEDEDIIIINKPAGLITHPGNGNSTHTLANGLLHYDASLHSVDRAGIVHRLDKDTSGLLVVAKNYHTQQHLIAQLQEKTVTREYNALCYGHIIAGGTIDEPIGRDSNNRLRQAVSESGKDAVTHYRTIEKFNDFTLLKVVLETGRTHQIRVHMAYIGHPLVGDGTYGKGLRLPKGASEELKTILKNFRRQALHAKKLAFIHPRTGKQVQFKAPLPDDMQELLVTIRNNNNAILL